MDCELGAIFFVTTETGIAKIQLSQLRLQNASCPVSNLGTDCNGKGWDVAALERLAQKLRTFALFSIFCHLCQMCLLSIYIKSFRFANRLIASVFHHQQIWHRLSSPYSLKISINVTVDQVSGKYY